jgi:hypothetical protein
VPRYNEAQNVSFAATYVPYTYIHPGSKFGFFPDVGIDIQPMVDTDSETMLACVKNHIYHGPEVAHIPTKFHLAADIVCENQFHMEFMATTEMHSDLLTMVLAKMAFLELC